MAFSFRDRFSVVYLTLLIVAALAIGVLGYGVLTQNKKIDQARYEQCVDGRTLIQTILLLSYGATPAQWANDPGAVLDGVRDQTIQQFADLGIDSTTDTAKKQIDRTVSNTRKLLDLADPGSCQRVA